MLFLRAATYLNVITKQNKKLLLFKQKHNYMLPMSEPKNKNNSIVDPQNILEEILSNLV
jgi:hypothetical protein